MTAGSVREDSSLDPPESLMAKLNDAWVVQPHGALTKLADGMLTVEGSIVMPLGKFPRRMTVLAVAAGGSAIWSPVDRKSVV